MENVFSIINVTVEYITTQQNHTWQIELWTEAMKAFSKTNKSSYFLYKKGWFGKGNKV